MNLWNTYTKEVDEGKIKWNRTRHKSSGSRWEKKKKKKKNWGGFPWVRNSTGITKMFFLFGLLNFLPFLSFLSSFFLLLLILILPPPPPPPLDYTHTVCILCTVCVCVVGNCSNSPNSSYLERRAGPGRRSRRPAHRMTMRLPARSNRKRNRKKKNRI